MRSITIISLLILLSFNYAYYTENFNLVPLLTDLIPEFLPKINQMLPKTQTTSTSFFSFSASAGIYFSQITRNNIYITIERKEVHLKIKNYKVKSKAELESFRWVKIFNFIPFIGKILSKIIKKTTSISAEGTIKTDVDIKFKLVSRSSSVIGVVVTYFRTNTDLSFMFGNAKISPFSGIISPIKKEVEKKILDVFARNKLQKAIDSSIDKLAYKLLKKIG